MKPKIDIEMTITKGVCYFLMVLTVVWVIWFNFALGGHRYSSSSGYYYNPDVYVP